MSSFQFFKDAAITLPLITKSLLHSDTGSTDPQDFIVYLGSNTVGVKIEDETAPGVNQMALSMANLTAEWALGTAYTLNQVRKSVVKNGYKFQVSVAGTSGGTEPAWDLTVGNTTAEGPDTLVWINIGKVHEITEVKLALTAIGLDTAVAGDPLNLGTSILSEVAEALPIHIRVDDDTEALGIETEIQFVTSSVLESVQ